MLIALDEARRLIAAHVETGGPVETPLAEAWGGILAEPAAADIPYPSADRSMMDGYVIGGNEPPGTFSVIGEIMAGSIPELRIGKGEAMRIFTGALLPEGGGRVLMQEDVQRKGDKITAEIFREQRFIRTMGSEAEAGDVVLEKGTSLGGAELAILAQVGHVRPKLVRRPVIRHIATGSELVAPDQRPGRGEIRDTNSSLLAGLFHGIGVELSDSRRAIDDPAAITEIAGSDWDLLLLSGGASVGDYDFGSEALRRLGFTIHFNRVNLRPGKPLTFATRGSQVAFVIPGNPVSHFVCFHVAVRLAVEILCGREPHWNFLPLEIAGGVDLQPDPRETFWPAQVSVSEGKLTVAPKGWSTSGDTFSLAGTNALVRVNASSPADGKADALLLDLPQADR